MNSIFDYYPSTFLKADDLKQKTVTLTIERVKEVELDNQKKPSLSFEGKDKEFVLNKTNAGTLAKLLSPNTDLWPGKKIQLFPTETWYQGSQVACIRVKERLPEQDPAPLVPNRVGLPADDPITDEDLPF